MQFVLDTDTALFLPAGEYRRIGTLNTAIYSFSEVLIYRVKYHDVKVAESRTFCSG
jgi:hypothetical protein